MASRKAATTCSISSKGRAASALAERRPCRRAARVLRRRRVTRTPGARLARGLERPRPGPNYLMPSPRHPELAMLADGDTLPPSGTYHGDGHLPRLRSAAAARAGGADAPRLRALRRLRHVLAGGVRGPGRPGPLPAPRRGDELPQDRRAVRPARLDRVARRTHELFPRELRLRRRGAHRRHRALPALRGLRRGGARDPRPAGGRAGDRVREPPRPGAGARRAYRRAGVPWREPEALPAVAHGRHAPLGALRRASHADRDRRRLVQRLPRRRVRLLPAG